MSGSQLMAMHRRILYLSDPMRRVRYEIRLSEAATKALEEETLISGAMPREFKVMLKFRTLTPFLTV